MNITLHKSKLTNKKSAITITGSKSESNRMLLLQALFPKITLENLSSSDDTRVMQKSLSSTNPIIDIHHAGTAMRFLTAFFATQEGREVILTGSPRMKERPIQVLVDALKELGADISYLENEGCPPLKIIGKSITRDKVSLNANVSSQYISALLLIAPKLKNGLELTLEGKITSIPYINMTLELLNQKGITTSFNGNIIKVHHQSTIKNHITHIESDWSSASYFYSIVALSEIGTEIELSTYKQNSLQGDSVLAEIYKEFGVETKFKNQSITIKKVAMHNAFRFMEGWDGTNSPDIAQTIAVCCFGLGIACHLTGLHTLKIKETDRLLALKTELEKFGADIEVTENSLTLKANDIFQWRESSLPMNGLEQVSITTYNDHRMAMAFAPLALKTSLQIEDAMVVSKSFPTFWDDLKSIGFKIN